MGRCWEILSKEVIFTLPAKLSVAHGGHRRKREDIIEAMVAMEKPDSTGSEQPNANQLLQARLETQTPFCFHHLEN